MKIKLKVRVTPEKLEKLKMFVDSIVAINRSFTTPDNRCGIILDGNLIERYKPQGEIK